MSEKKSVRKKPTDWKSISEKLAQKVMWAVMYLDTPGRSGMIINIKTGKSESWRENFADAMEQIPGLKIDREKMHIFGLPYGRQRKARKELEARRSAKTKAHTK